MNKTTLTFKIIPLLFSVPVLLTGCQELQGFFGDSSSRSPGHDSSYSSESQGKGHQNLPSEGNQTTGKKASVKGIPASQSETAATTVTTPVSTEKKTANGTVAAPAVPSSAPTVGQ